jgi:hypothetical protein
LRKYRDQARELACGRLAKKPEPWPERQGAETGCVVNIHENSGRITTAGWYGS